MFFKRYFFEAPLLKCIAKIVGIERLDQEHIRATLYAHQLIIIILSGSVPLLLLNGEVLSAGSSITFGQIGEGPQALLCVTTNKSCCDHETAQFLTPSNTPVQGDGALHVTMGRQIVRLNHASDTTALEEGSYCCSVPNDERSCIDIKN